MKYRYEIDWDWVHTPDDVNDLIQDEEHPTLTSAEQIISISYDIVQHAYLVTWRVRKWADGSAGP